MFCGKSERHLVQLHADFWTDKDNQLQQQNKCFVDLSTRSLPLLSRDSAVGTAIGYGLDEGGVGVRVPVGSRIFFIPTLSRPALGPTQPPIQWVPGALSPEVKRQGRDADHSPPISAEVKKMWIYTSTPPYAFMV
jgi:hypothetical protein